MGSIKLKPFTRWERQLSYYNKIFNTNKGLLAIRVGANLIAIGNTDVDKEGVISIEPVKTGSLESFVAAGSGVQNMSSLRVLSENTTKN